MMTKRIIIACGAGLATSTMITEKVKQILEEAGIDYTITQSQIYELDSYDGTADLFVTSMKVEEDKYQAPIVVSNPFIMGINDDHAKEKSINELKEEGGMELFIIDYFLDLGSTVFVPLVLIIIGLILGQGILKAIRSGIVVGIGFVGLNLAISLISDILEPAVKQITERFNLDLTVIVIIDSGSGASECVTFSYFVCALIIPAVIILNLILLLLGFTKTMNIDIFNYSHYAFTGAVVHLITGNIVIAMGASLIQATWSLLSADYSAKKVQHMLGVDGISIPQGFAASTVPLFAVMEKLYNRIPYLRDSKLDLSHLQKKVGTFGDPVIIGTILGIIIALLSGYNFADGANLVIGV